jgi:hypothetical protein
MVAQFRCFAAAAVGGDGRAAQVVAEQEIQRAAPLAHRHALSAGGVLNH